MLVILFSEAKEPDNIALVALNRPRVSRILDLQY